MKDFKKYREEEGARRETNPSPQSDMREGKKSGMGASDGFPDEGEAAELAKKALAAYNGRSESSVLAEIVREAEKMKKAGKLSDAELDAFYRQFSPMLDAGQRKKFRSVIERLKKL